jgi:hypothetical protein
MNLFFFRSQCEMWCCGPSGGIPIPDTDFIDTLTYQVYAAKGWQEIKLSKLIVENPLGCATLLPVKSFQIFGECKIFLNFCPIFTGRSVAQVSVPSYYF